MVFTMFMGVKKDQISLPWVSQVGPADTGILKAKPVAKFIICQNGWRMPLCVLHT